MLGQVVEILASAYGLMDFIHIWFADGSDETGLRLSQDTLRVATEKAVYLYYIYFVLNISFIFIRRIPPALAHNTSLRQQQKASPTHSEPAKQLDRPEQNGTNGTTGDSTSVTPQTPPAYPALASITPFNIPSSLPIFQIPQVPKPNPPPATLDTALVLAKMLHDDKLRSRIYTDPSLLFDLCCSLGLDKRQVKFCCI